MNSSTVDVSQWAKYDHIATVAAGVLLLIFLVSFLVMLFTDRKSTPKEGTRKATVVSLVSTVVSFVMILGVVVFVNINNNAAEREVSRAFGMEITPGALRGFLFSSGNKAETFVGYTSTDPTNTEAAKIDAVMLTYEDGTVTLAPLATVSTY